MISQFLSGSRRRKSWSKALAAAALITAFAVPASAASVFGVPAQVEYGTVLLVQFNGINYVAQPSSPGCNIPGTSADTLKIWVSMSQAALLAGKNMVIYYDVCGTKSYIRDLVLVK